MEYLLTTDEWTALAEEFREAWEAADAPLMAEVLDDLFADPGFPSDGPRVARWLACYVVQTKGRFSRRPLVAEPWQYEFLCELYRLDPATGRRVYTEATLGLPRKNGKSTLVSGLALYHLSADGEESPEVYVGAGSRDQASVVFRQSRDTVESSPRLDFLKTYQHHIAYAARRGLFRVIPSDARLQHGSNPSASFIDEKWAHKSNDLTVALTSGTGAREEPLTVTITTAGDDLQGSPLGEDVRAARALPDREVRRDGFLQIARDLESGYLYWWFGPPVDDGGQYVVDLEDPEVWAACNPASWVTVEYLTRQRRKPSVRLTDFQRFHLNAWTDAEDYWLPAGAWQACGPTGGREFHGFVLPHDLERHGQGYLSRLAGLEPDEFLEEVAAVRAELQESHGYERATLYLGVDMGQKKDNAAVVAVRPRDEDGERVYDSRAFIIAPGDGQKVDQGELRAYVLLCHLLHDVEEVAYDPWRFTESALMLEAQGVTMREFAQRNEVMAPASEGLYEKVVAGRVRHDGDQEFARHVAAGVTAETERGWRLVKRRRNVKHSPPMVDALIGLLMAVAVASLDESEGESVYESRDLLVL